MAETLYVRGPKSRVLDAVRSLPALAAGRAPASGPDAAGLALRLGTLAMSYVRDAYVAKARGGTDAAGDSWAPLAESTIEGRLRKKGVSRARAARELKEAYKHVARTGKLTKRLQRAKKKAAATFAAVAGIEILRDTGRLFNSLSPGVDGTPRPDGLLAVLPGTAVVGTNVTYAKFHQTGTRRMPQRRLWPEPGRWPAAWRLGLLRALASGLVLVLKRRLAGGGP